MDASTIIGNTKIAGLDLVATNSTQTMGQFIHSGKECYDSVLASISSSSTRFNNSERFSLEQLRSNKRKLDSIKKLTSNWNGYEGERFESKLITMIQDIISELDYQPQIFPTGRGSIQIEKYINDDNFVEIEVTNDEIFAYQVKNGKEIEKEISVAEINGLITELFA